MSIKSTTTIKTERARRLLITALADAHRTELEKLLDYCSDSEILGFSIFDNWNVTNWDKDDYVD